MSSKAKIWLYKEGNECTSITGGWNKAGYVPYYVSHKGTKRANDFFFQGDATHRTRSAFSTANKLDISKLGKAGIIHTKNSDIIDAVQAHIAGVNIPNSTIDNISGNISSSNPQCTIYFQSEYDIDISSSNKTPCYIYIDGCLNPNDSIYVTEVYFESIDDIITVKTKNGNETVFEFNTVNNWIEPTQIDIIYENEIIQTITENLEDDISITLDQAGMYLLRVSYTQGDGINNVAEVEYDFYFDSPNGIDTNTVFYLRGDSFKDISIYNNTSWIVNNNMTLENGMMRSDNTYMQLKCNDILALISKPATIEFDIIATSHGVNGLSTAPMSRGHIANKSIPDYELSFSDTAISMRTGSGANTSSSTTDVFNYPMGLNKKFHIAITFDGKKSYSVFVDGKYLGTHVATYKPTSSKDLFIGDRQSLDYSEHFYMANFRVSDIVRYTTDFTKPDKPYTSIFTSNFSFENHKLSCIINKTSANESIKKIDILLNNNVVQTYNEVSVVNHIFDEDDFTYGINNIELRVYYYEDYYINESTTYHKKIHLENVVLPELLPNTANFSEVVSRIFTLHNINSINNRNLKKILKTKNFIVDDNAGINDMIRLLAEVDINNNSEVNDYVNRIIELEDTINNQNNQISIYTNSLRNILLSKGVGEINESTELSELINKVNSLVYSDSALYLYNKGNEYTNLTGGWVAAGQSGTTGKITITKSDTTIKYVNNTGSVSYCNGGVTTAKPVDFTNYSKLYIHLTNGRYGYSDYWLSIMVNKNNPIGNSDSPIELKALAKNESKVDKLISIDISNINGYYHLYFIDRPLGCWTEFDKVWLEK
jgi:hypothetical protein